MCEYTKCEYCDSIVVKAGSNCPNCGAVLPEQEEAEYVELYADDEIIELEKINPLFSKSGLRFDWM